MRAVAALRLCAMAHIQDPVACATVCARNGDPLENEVQDRNPENARASAGQLEVVDIDNPRREALLHLPTAESRNAALDLPVANRVLAALPRADYRRLLPALEPVTLGFGEVLHESGAPIRHVYFPVGAVVCLLTVTGCRRTVETGLVGYEGMVGISLALGVDVSSARAVAQVAGTAMRMSATRFCSELQECLPLQREVYRCAHVKMAQARQTAACAASHLFEQRFACWLLMTSDRSRSPEILLTQEYLAAVLGVRRVSVTSACGSLRSRKLISHDRGRIRILDRKGLEAASCSCYRKVEVLHA
jgi:CRP-like cAMP-binding protein